MTCPALTPHLVFNFPGGFKIQDAWWIENQYGCQMEVRTTVVDFANPPPYSPIPDGWKDDWNKQALLNLIKGKVRDQVKEKYSQPVSTSYHNFHRPAGGGVRGKELPSSDPLPVYSAAFLEAQKTNHEWAYFHVPEGIDNLSFSIFVENPGDGDVFRLVFNGEEVWTVDLADLGAGEHFISIPFEAFAGQEGTLHFILYGAGAANARVLVGDDFYFSEVGEFNEYVPEENPGKIDVVKNSDGGQTITLDKAKALKNGAGSSGEDLLYTSVSLNALPKKIEDVAVNTDKGLTIHGNNSDNRILGGDGKDKFYGEGGNDILVGGKGKDTLVGGPGDDYYQVDDSRDKVVEKSGAGIDAVESWLSFSFADKPHLENLYLNGTAVLNGVGNSLANVIVGNHGNNHLDGREGDDFLFGEAGNDTLIGGDGKDTLDGGLGNDTLSGGAGANTFVFSGAIGLDTITDWKDAAGNETVPDGLDRIDLSAFKSLTGGVKLTMDDLILVQSGSSVRVFLDFDRDGVADAIDLDGDGDATPDGACITVLNAMVKNFEAADFVF